MYKNQLQELAQRSCFNLPSYACIREGPDHAPRFRASVNFNGEIFEGPSYCTTLRQAEHAAAEVALNTLSTRGPSRSLTARVIDETGVYKNLLQETAHRAGLHLPVYTTVRSGPGHVPVFTCTVELAGMNFSGEPAKTKKQAEKNAALAAWSTLKQMPNLGSSSQTSKETESNEEQEQVVVARVLSKFSPKDETKPGKQRNLNQARKRMVPGYRDNNNRCGSSQNSLLYPQWRSMGLLSDFYPVSGQNQNQQQSRILGPLTPLPHPTILRPNSSREKENPSHFSSNRSIPVQVRSKSQVKIQEIPAPIEEHQKDEEEWLTGKAFVSEKSIAKDAKEGNSSTGLRPKPTYQMPPFPLLTKNPMPDQNITQQNQIRKKAYGPPHPSIAPAFTRCMAHTAFSLPRSINTVGFYTHNMAPAVHVRSVVPVCAAPPMRSPTSNLLPKPSQVKEASPPSVSASVSIHTEQEVAAASLKLNNLQL
ncbi:Double-stranded RNA-binding domain [Macleaya cordata]|uniref:Double-stranded RNA-binding domain n=1 Tax=Macleaya cordata TaxID=56857 RepID=A0A200R3X4_MACCD|nr:Double-stranded RNA-binding domain [Macleaya cordata]